jgi:hypothetical protein
VQRAAGPQGKPEAVYFDSVIRTDPANPESALQGRGRLHLELVSLRLVGIKAETLSPGDRFAARFLFNALSPFVLLILVSLLTRPPEKSRIDQFFGRMKTPVGATPKEEEAAMEATRRDPNRFQHTKLFPNSSWEFARWDKVDTIGFLICCAVSGSIIALFVGLLTWAGPG